MVPDVTSGNSNSVRDCEGNVRLDLPVMAIEVLGFEDRKEHAS